MKKLITPLLFLGDAHNFGRKVSLVNQEQRLYIRKPRSVFWERFFLDKDFFFRKELKELLPEIEEVISIAFGEIDGGFHLQPDGSYLIKYLNDSHKSLNIENKEKDAAALVVCAFIFGIEDLHKENFVQHSGKLHLIDIECVFSQYLLIQESSLMTYNIKSKNRSGLFFYGDVANWDTSEKVVFVNELLKIIKLFMNNEHLLAMVLVNNHHIMSKEKVRVLYRPTFEYLEALRLNEIDKFSPEEKVQLYRNDIPYFFSYLDSKGVFYYTNNNLSEFEAVSSKELRQHKIVNRICKEPLFFLKNRLVIDFPIFLSGLIKTIFFINEFPIFYEDWSISKVAEDSFLFQTDFINFTITSKSWRKYSEN